MEFGPLLWFIALSPDPFLKLFQDVSRSRVYYELHCKVKEVVDERKRRVLLATSVKKGRCEKGTRSEGMGDGG